MSPFLPLSDAGLNTTFAPPKTVADTLKSPSRKNNEDHSSNMQENIPPASPASIGAELNERPKSRAASPKKQCSPQKLRPITPVTPVSVPVKHTESDPFLEATFSERKKTNIAIQEEEDDKMSNTSNETGQGFNPDDTCFSAFSAVPNADLTAFARLGQSPIRPESALRGRATPIRQVPPMTPGTAVPNRYNGSPSKTPRNTIRPEQGSDEATTQLLEFTEQLQFHQTSRDSPTRSALSPSRLRSQPNLHTSSTQQAMRSPNRGGNGGYNLLDFDLPPLPTPRSIPTITARELESLKAGFLSELSSLKAKLSGQQAETRFLQEAKDDAERRVGDLSEELRDIRGARDSLVEEKEDWEKRDKDMQDILREVKNELLLREKERETERDDLNSSISDLEKRLETAEARASEAESKVAGLQTQVHSQDQTLSPTKTPSSQAQNIPNGPNPTTPGSNNAVEVAVDRVARDLHALYKNKHEQKVGQLKKSYEARWDRRVKDLERKVDDLTRENEDLKVGRDATMSTVMPNAIRKLTEQESPNAKDAMKKELEEKKEELQKLLEEKETAGSEVREIRAKLEACQKGIVRLESDNKQLAVDLEASRRENGELVAAVDELLALQSKDPTPPPAPADQPQPAARPLSNGFENSVKPGFGAGLGSSVAPASKISGLRGPGFGGTYGESRIGTFKRSTSGGTGVRSGIMSNIERMGKGRGAE